MFPRVVVLSCAVAATLFLFACGESSTDTANDVESSPAEALCLPRIEVRHCGGRSYVSRDVLEAVRRRGLIPTPSGDPGSQGPAQPLTLAPGPEELRPAVEPPSGAPRVPPGAEPRPPTPEGRPIPAPQPPGPEALEHTVLPTPLPGQSPVYIGGGERSAEGAHPYATSLATPYGDTGHRSLCSGSLIDDDWVLTAAHCLLVPGNYALVGGTDVSSDSKAGTLREYRAACVHPQYDYCTRDFDVALIHLTPVSAGAMSQPIDPISEAQTLDQPGNRAVAMGFGKASRDLEDGVLNEVTIPIIDKSECQASYTYSLTDNMLCAGDREHGLCVGDSGGSLIGESNGKRYLIATASFDQGFACLGNYRSVFTRIKPVLPWINAVKQAVVADEVE